MVEICVKAAVNNPEALGDCHVCHRLIIYLKEKGVDYQQNLINLDDPPQWFKDENPSRELPALKHDGNWVTDVQRIFELIEEWHPEPRLATPEEYIEAEMRFQALYGYCWDYLQCPDDCDDEARDALDSELRALDEHLRDNGPYIAGLHFTGADINIVPMLVILVAACSKYKDYEFMARFHHIRNYYGLMLDKPSITKSCPEEEAVLAGWERKFNR